MLDRIKSAVEHDDHFAVDDGSGAPFRVAKAALSPAMVERVRRLYCGGTVARMALGGVAAVPDDVAAGTLPDDQGGSTTSGVMAAPDLSGAALDQPLALPAELTTPAAPLAEVGPPAPVETPAPLPAPVEVAPVDVAPAPAAPTPAEVAPAPTLTPATAAPVAAPAAAATPPVVAPAPAVPQPAVSEIPSVTVTPAAIPAALPAAPDVRAMLETAAKGFAPAGAEAADIAAARPLAEARAAREQAADRERLATAELARQAAIEREQDRVAAEKEAADLVRIARQHEEAKRAATVDLNAKAQAYRDTETARVEAGRLWSNMAGWQTALAGFSMLLGGAVSGVTGRSNEAADVIERAIDRDIEEQRRAIAANRSIRLKEYEAAGATLSQASELLRADMLNLQAARARSTAAMQTSRASRDAFNQLAISLEAKRTAAVETALNDMGAAAVSASLARRALSRDQLALKGEQQRQQLAVRADRRADAALALDRERLGLEKQKLAIDAAKAAAAQRAAAIGESAAIAGRLGQALTPEQWARIPEDKERNRYVAVTTDKGEPGYRLAMSDKAAEELRSLDLAVERGLSNAKDLAKYIGPDAPTILPGTKAKAESEALQQKLIMAIKNIEDLGALTQADMGLVRPLIPDPQSWTTTAGQEAAQLKQLTDSFRLLRKLSLKNKLALSADERKAIDDEVRAEVGAQTGGAK